MTTHFNPASCPSPSALRVAASRALHQLLDTQRVFDDPFAIGILGAATAAQLMLDPDAHNDVTARSMRAGMVARSRFAEDRVLRAIAAGVQQYVIVGAGLDTWALRHAQSCRACRCLSWTSLPCSSGSSRCSWPMAGTCIRACTGYL